MTGDLLVAALDYAARGWPVLPCIPGEKRPHGRLVRHGLRDATTDEAMIRAWWRAVPTANIGLVTGVAFDVLDVDGPTALDALEAAGPIGGEDIEGPTVATPRGWHCYVAPTGRGNTVSLGGLAGVDFRGVGGYVVAPPSRKADGTTWSWVTTGTPLDRGPDTPIVRVPAWVLDLFNRRDPPSVPPVTRHGGRTAYGVGALERELGRLAVASEGERNHQLNRAAFSLARLIAGGALELAEVGDALYAVALRIGLGETEAERTIKSGLAAGFRRPRTPGDDR